MIVSLRGPLVPLVLRALLKERCATILSNSSSVWQRLKVFIDKMEFTQGIVE
jgi:hypothetical protein